MSSSEGLVAVLRRAVIIGALLEFANGFRSFGYLQISFAFFLIIVGPLPAASDAIPLFFPGCFIVGGGGRGGAALRGRG